MTSPGQQSCKETKHRSLTTERKEKTKQKNPPQKTEVDWLETPTIILWLNA